MKTQIANLERNIKEMEATHKQRETQLERENITNTENLRKEMLTKIKETKANLLALNDE